MSKGVPCVLKIVSAVAYVLLGAPLCGFVMALLVGRLSLGSEGAAPSFGFLLMYAISYGAVTGAVFGILSVGFLWREKWRNSFAYLSGGALLLAVPLAFVPEKGPMLAWLGSMAGFWLGFLALKTTQRPLGCPFRACTPPTPGTGPSNDHPAA